MSEVTIEHFERAAADIGAHGDNDTLPFDIDNRFIKDTQLELANIAFNFYLELAAGSHKSAKNAINSLAIFSERLLVPTGPSGFRITTKIHPFWNLYFNALGIAIAAANEPFRNERAHSYRFATAGDSLFNRSESWRSFREASITDCLAHGDDAIVVQTDISSFYEHIYHHRIENCIADLFPPSSTVAIQIDRFLSKFASGRSFGLPVGGQCSRILAEVLMASIDSMLSDAKIVWRRYVDDFVLVTANQADAYKALAVLSHALADYGLTLNRTKTIMLTTKHYIDYVKTQLGSEGDEGNKLREIDLHFDPYSDNADAEYEELKQTVESLEIQSLIEQELRKGQPDAFLVSQISRTLKLHNPEAALQICRTLLVPKNLHSFRASWSTIMRGINTIRASDDFKDIFDGLDELLDGIPEHSAHLLQAESSCLHYLRTIRFKRTPARAAHLLSLYSSSHSETINKACIECWKTWRDRTSFIRVRNKWDSLGSEEQRALWLSAKEFGEEGIKFQAQTKMSLSTTWSLGIERNQGSNFSTIYAKWASGDN